MRFGIAALLIATCMAGSAQSARAGYTFTDVADTTAFESFTQLPAINNAGQVVFTAELPAALGLGSEGIFVGTSKALPYTIIATTNTNGPGNLNFSGFSMNAGVPTGFSAPSINANGAVAFGATFQFAGATVSGIFTGSGGPTTTIATNFGGGFNSFGDPVINSKGTVVFWASVAGGQSAIEANGVAGSANVVATEPSSPFVILGTHPTVNDSGTVTFVGVSTTGGIPTYAIYYGTTNGGANTTGSYLNSPYFLGGFVGSSPALNNNGDIAAIGLDNSGNQYLFAVGPNYPYKLLADNLLGSPFTSFGNVSINQSDTVAFSATSVTGAYGIYASSNGTNNPVIAVGDALFGSTVTSLQYGGGGLNDSGQITFLATLANGLETVVVATPQAVPEPTSVALTLTGLAAFACAHLARSRVKRVRTSTSAD